MRLQKYEVAELPKVAVRHNLGDKLGMVTISEELSAEYTDETAQECVKHGLPYFKKKEGVEAKKPVAKVVAPAVAKKPVAKTTKVTAPVVTESVATA